MSLFNDIIYTREEIQTTLDNMYRTARINKELAIESLDDKERELFSKKYFAILNRIRQLEEKIKSYE